FFVTAQSVGHFFFLRFNPDLSFDNHSSASFCDVFASLTRCSSDRIYSLITYPDYLRNLKIIFFSRRSRGFSQKAFFRLTAQSAGHLLFLPLKPHSSSDNLSSASFCAVCGTFFFSRCNRIYSLIPYP